MPDEQNERANDHVYLLRSLEKIRQKLLDHTKRNRLLNYKEKAKDVAIIDEMANFVFEDLVKENKKYYFSHLDKKQLPDSTIDLFEDTEVDRTLPAAAATRQEVAPRHRDNKLQTPYSEKDLDRRLRTLYQEHRMWIEETGANCLFIAMGFLEWSDTEGDATALRSPLMLVPVRIEREGTAGQAKYAVSFDDEAIDSNYSLVEKLKKSFDLTLPLIEEEEDPESYWKRIESAINTQTQHSWRVVREMAVGIFRFNRLVMWHDLDPKRWPTHAPLVDKKVLNRILVGPRPGEPEPGQIKTEYVQDGDERDLTLPHVNLIRDADSSQYSALIQSLTCDGGLVIEGPPGTGKSQTITNIIAAALDTGRSVLFVAEKMAALDVVFKRLSESGLDPFCLQLHGLKTNKKELLSDLDRRLNYCPENMASLETTSRELQKTRVDLVAYSKAISSCVGPESIPLYDVAWRVERLRQELPNEIDDLAIELKLDIDYEGFISNKNLLNDLGREWSEIPKDAREAWAGYLPTTFVEKNSSTLTESNDVVMARLLSLKEYLVRHGADKAANCLFEIQTILDLASHRPEAVLPELPAEADPTIVLRVIRQNAIEQYKELIFNIEKYLADVNKVNSVFDYSASRADEYVHLLDIHSKSLTGIALQGSVAVNQLDFEIADLDSVVTCLQSLQSDAQYFLDLHRIVARTIEDFSRVSERAKEVDSAPTDLALHANPSHAKPSIKNYLQRAKVRCEELNSKLPTFSEFAIARVISAEEINGTKRVIEANVSNIFATLNREYRNARNSAKRYLHNAAGYKRSNEFVERLGLFAKFVREREEYAKNTDFIAAFGNSFRGVDTDWSKLEGLITFSNDLREKVGIDYAVQILSNWDAHIDKITELRSRIDSSIDNVRDYARKHPFPSVFWKRPVTEIASTLFPWKSKLEKAKQDLQQPWCQTSSTLKDLGHAVDAFRRARDHEKDIETSDTFRSLLGGTWEKGLTDVDRLKANLKWIVERLSYQGVNTQTLGWLITDEGKPNSDRCRQLYDLLDAFFASWRKNISDLESFGRLETSRWVGGANATIDTFEKKLTHANRTVSNLLPMERWVRTKDIASSKGFEAISENTSADLLNGDQCGKAYEYSLYNAIYTKEIKSNPRLANFTPSAYESTRDRFTTLDRKIMDVNAKQIAYKLANSTVPAGIGSGPVSNYTDRRLIEHEIRKKSRHIPIRQLVSRAGLAMKALKPCFMMSPLSVAQYLGPGAIHFDLVVMDEASQVRPEDALGTIARAERAIIVGDPKQLPPTSFFDSVANDDADSDDDATVVDDTEAILDVCLKQFPYRRLRWHYRSEHEKLIQFSNEQFYDGDLIIFPSPKPDSREYGVHFNYVGSTSYKKGRNRHEAEVVVNNIILHAKKHPNLSLGVAAFNKVQAEEISLLLEKARQKDRVADELLSKHRTDEPLFIKNLENVQGDERDVIFISTTYGRENSVAPVVQRFGPINSDTGWRRLNVIATRAKKRVEVFTSMRHTDINIGENARKGVRSLRDYLEYASTGRIKEQGSLSGQAPDSEFEIAVMRLLKTLGYDCDPQVGVAGFFIDIGVRNPDRPGEYLLGIECDGAAYHTAKSVRDRDRLRQQILESKGWYIHRIWSTNWFHSRSTEIDRLQRILKRRLEEDRLSYEQIRATQNVQEVVIEVETATEQEIATESKENSLLLVEALERFWEKNIKPRYPDRSRSILSKRMVEMLAETKPTDKNEWFSKIPDSIRRSINPDEGEFRQDIFDIIEEYAYV